MADYQSNEELPGATKYENESAYQRNPGNKAAAQGEFQGSHPTAEELQQDLPSPEEIGEDG